MKLNKQFWDEKYNSQQTGWDLKGPSTPLKNYIDQLEDKEISILIPGCGNAYEAEYLLEKGFKNVQLIDISGVIVEELQEKFKNNQAIKIIHGDFFELEGSYDLILEQTFFCAIDPSLRQLYAKKTHQLLNNNGRIAGVLFNREFGNTLPPFGGNQIEYTEYFKALFNIKTMETCYNSIPPRANSELFIKLIKR